MVNLPPKSTAPDEKIRTGKKSLCQGQFQHSRLGYSPGGIEHVVGEKTDDRRTLEPSAVLGRRLLYSVGGISSFRRNAEP